MAKISDSLRSAHPDAPWLWREDWASGRMKSSQGAVATVSCLFAVVFSGFSIPLVAKAGELIEKEGIGVALLAAIFPIAAVGLSYWAVTETARWLRFRETHLEIETRPGVVGGRFTATVHVGRVVTADGGFSGRLSCLKRSRTGNKSHESTIWQHEITIPMTHVRRGPFGSAVPVSFDIPFESEPTSVDSSRLPSVQWRLEVAAELAGVDFSSVFDVPVFKTEQSSEDVTERFEMRSSGPRNPPAARVASGSPLEDERISVERANDGSLEIGLPASRNRAGALFLTIFALFWNGFVFVVGRELPGPMALFLAPFALVGLLIALFVPVVWLQSTTIRARPGILTIRQRMLGAGTSRDFALEEIEAIVPKAQGGNAGRTNWSVKIQPSNGSKARAAAQNLKSKDDAQKIAALLTDAISRGQ